MLVFVCTSPVDPATLSAKGLHPGQRGAALFYSTLSASRYDLSEQARWTKPRMIANSWQPLGANKHGSDCVYTDWYPTLMSDGAAPGYLGAGGYVFAMSGCTDRSAGRPREYVSVPFTITFSPPLPTPEPPQPSSG